MKDLSKLTNEELLQEFENFNNFYEAENSIDYGEFTGGYPEEYYETSEEFGREFEKREIVLEDMSEMPY